MQVSRGNGGGGGRVAAVAAAARGSTCTRTRSTAPPALPSAKTPCGPRVYEYIPHPLGHMCKNPIYRSREGNLWRITKTCTSSRSPTAAATTTCSSRRRRRSRSPRPPVQLQPAGRTKRWKSHHLRSPAYSVSTIEPREDLLAGAGRRSLLQGHFRTGQTLRHHPRWQQPPGIPQIPVQPRCLHLLPPTITPRRPHQYLHPGGGGQQAEGTGALQPPSAVFVEPNRNEYLELKVKLNVEPDYLEVLEKQTTFSQF